MFRKLTEALGATLALVAIAVLIATLFIFIPWLTIWAINTLVTAGGVVGFHIPLNFWTWLAALLIHGTWIRFKS